MQTAKLIYQKDLMKWWTLFAGVVGLAVGLVLRESTSPKSGNEVGPDEIVKAGRSTDQIRGEILLPDSPFQWGIKGDLDFQEIMQLPKGAVRDAEAILWAQSASSSEIARLWKELSNDPSSTWQHRKQLMSVWIRKDREGVFAHVRASRSEEMFYRALARIDPTEALARAKDRGSYVWGMTLSVIAEDDPQKAISLLSECGSQTSWSVLRGIANGLMKEDPRAALGFLNTTRERWIQVECLKRWAMDDPAGALDWAVDHNPEGILKLVGRILEKDPELLARKVEEMPAGRVKRDLQVARAGWILKQDPKAAIQFAKAQPIGVRKLALSKIGAELPSEASELKMEVLQSLVQENDGKDQSAMNRVPEWIMEELLRDPPAVMEIYEENAPANLAPLVTDWTRKDPEKSVAWLSKRNDHEYYDSMTTSIFFRLGLAGESLTEEQMLGLLSDLSDAGKVRSYSRQTLRDWHRRDPEGLENYFESGSATPGQTQWWKEQSQ